MTTIISSLVRRFEFSRTLATYQTRKQIAFLKGIIVRIVLKGTLVFMLVMPQFVFVDITYKGHFVNPVTSICWSYLMPNPIDNFAIIADGFSSRKMDMNSEARGILK